jgi:hypothetical protein
VDTPYPRALAAFPQIRQSHLAAFDRCSLAAFFEQTKRRGWSTHDQARGTMFHRVAAECIREMVRQRESQIPVDSALAILHEKLRQDDVDRECPECGTTSIQPGLWNGRRRCADGHDFQTDFVNLPMSAVKDLFWVTKKWAKDNSFSWQSVVDVEDRLSATVRYSHPDGGWVERVLTGQIDALLVEGAAAERAIVLDWKDTWALPPETEISFQGYFQQRFYAWLIMRNHDFIESVTLREFYVRRSQPREATLWRGDLDDIEMELAALAERFDRLWEEAFTLSEQKKRALRAFPPTPGKHCSYCLAPMLCPIDAFARGEGRIRTSQEAELSASRLTAAEAIVKQEKAALAAWVDSRGPVPIHDAKGRRVYGYRQSQRVDKPSKSDLAKALAEAGSVRNLDLESLYKPVTTTRFEQFVPDPEQAAVADRDMIAALEGSLAEAKVRVGAQEGE